MRDGQYYSPQEAGVVPTEQLEKEKQQLAADRAQADCIGVGTGVAGKIGTGGTISANLAMQLKMRRDVAKHDFDRTGRALKLLELHPEWEDFLWLLRSGLV